MKRLTCFYVVGGIAAGFVAYCIYKQLREKNGKKSIDVEDSSGDSFVASGYYPAEVTSEQAAISDFEEIQRHAVNSIRKNHVDAAQQLGAVVDEVTSNSAEFKKTNNQVSRDLDELMK